MSKDNLPETIINKFYGIDLANKWIHQMVGKGYVFHQMEAVQEGNVITLFIAMTRHYEPKA